jgi:Leucine-rich repeat (LRR) protein
MTPTSKIKKHLLLVLCLLLGSWAMVGQTLTDQQIGFDVARTTTMLKKYGLKDLDLAREINMMREIQQRQYLEMKKIEDGILQKTQANEIGKSSTSRVASTSKTAFVDIPQIERDALNAFYIATNGANWFNTLANNKPWKINDLTSDVSTWYGVGVSNGHVVSLNIPKNNLNGNITSQIGQLKFITYLNLSDNILNGEIPKEIGQLTNLDSIDLFNNKLTGILVDEFYSLINLRIIRMYNNQISGNISQIWKLNKLIILWLSGNQLTGVIPSQISQISGLLSISFTNNQLSGTIPIEIGQLKNLTSLSLSSNQLTGSIPYEIGKLSNLVDLFLTGNQLSGNLPAEIGDLTNLRYLWLNGNNFSGTVPSSFGNLSNLYEFALHYNNLEGTLPLSIESLPKLYRFFISKNKFFGKVPNLTSSLVLGQIYLDSNEFRFIDFIDQFSVYKSKANPFYFSPQAKINVPETITKPAGQSVDLKMYADGDTRYLADDTYKWFKNGTAIAGATSRVLTLPSLTATDVGTYVCKSYHTTNPDMSELVLEREPITLKVSNCPTVVGTIKVGTNTAVIPLLTAGGDNFFSLDTATTGLTYLWTFYKLDGITPESTATTAVAKKWFSQTGEIKVQLVVTDAGGCKTTFFKTVRVIDPCFPVVATITVNPTAPTTGVANSFALNVQSLVGGTHKWIFYNPDGTTIKDDTQTTPTATQTYAVAGTYKVRLMSTFKYCDRIYDTTITVKQTCVPTLGRIKFIPKVLAEPSLDRKTTTKTNL